MLVFSVDVYDCVSVDYDEEEWQDIPDAEMFDFTSYKTGCWQKVQLKGVCRGWSEQQVPVDTVFTKNWRPIKKKHLKWGKIISKDKGICYIWHGYIGPKKKGSASKKDKDIKRQVQHPGLPSPLPFPSSPSHTNIHTRLGYVRTVHIVCSPSIYKPVPYHRFGNKVSCQRIFCKLLRICGHHVGRAI